MLSGKLCLITGATRGIGRSLALTLASQGCNIVVTGKTAEPTPNLPGTVFSVAEEVEAVGTRALPVVCDLRDDKSVEDMVAATVTEFGKGPDILINNSGAMFWKGMLETNMKRFDLMMDVNARGAYHVTRACLPHMIEQGYGHIIMQSPPIAPSLGVLGGRTAYMMSKLGMTLCALGVAQETKDIPVAANTLWPVTLIESAAVINHGIGKPEHWRKPTILTDCVTSILGEDPTTFSGNELLDEAYLRSKGETDFGKYQCVPGKEPPTMAKLDSMLRQ